MSSAAARRNGALLALALGALGLLLAFRVEIGSGGDQLRGLGTDERQVHWVLEWISLCAAGDPLCRDLWSPPYFFPQANGLAFGDPLLGLGLAYAGIRALGSAPLPAFVLTLILTVALDYLAALWLLRRALGFAPLPAALGAFLFAYGAPRAAQYGHPQLLAEFPVPLLLGALALLLTSAVPRRRGALWALAAAALVAQAYLDLNLFWLVGFLLAWTAIAALALPTTRRALRARLLEDRGPALAAAAATALALFPLARRMLQSRQLVQGAHSLSQLFDLLPQPESWINVGAQNWVWSSLSRWPPIRDLPLRWEHELGVGLVTSAACLAGVWLARRHRWGRVLALGVAATLLLSLRWPGGFTLWRAIHELWPGAESVRALGRLSLVLLAPAAIALARATEALRAAARPALVAAFAALVMLEQQRDFDTFRPADTEARVAALAAAVPADCPSFYWSPVGGLPAISSWTAQLDAMWASLAARVPTANGYTSYAPLNWFDLHDNRIETRERRRELLDRLEFWADTAGARPGEICWLATEPAGAALRVVRLLRVDPGRNPWRRPGERAGSARR